MEAMSITTCDQTSRAYRYHTTVRFVKSQFSGEFQTVAKSGFAYRLAYVRWLRQRGRTDFETDRELAGALGVGVPWFAKWKGSPESPDTRSQIRAIVTALAPLGVTEAWLIDGEGPAPEPNLWRWWTAPPIEHPPARTHDDVPVARPQAAKKSRRGNGPK